MRIESSTTKAIATKNINTDKHIDDSVSCHQDGILQIFMLPYVIQEDSIARIEKVSV